jgi:hypothetical protein
VGSATTTAATLTVTAGPVITTNPVSQTVNALSPVSFTAAATGTPAPTVQWQLSTDGGASYSNLPAATSTTLAFTADGSMNGYKYRAVFTNSAGSATTTPATLTVTKLTPTITWSNPADILFGSALGSGQLNATASVAGSLVYTPGIGTVPPVGDGQTLRVDFTPTDTANYTAAFKTVVINVKPTGGSPANLLASSVLTRDGNTNEVIVTVTVANTGGTAASTVLLTAANIGATSTTTQLPIALGSIAAGGQATAVVRLPGSVGTAGTRVVLSLTGSFGGGGSFGGNTRVVLP